MKYLTSHGKRILHLILCVIIVFAFPIAGLIVFLIKEGMAGSTITYWTTIIITIFVVQNIKDYRDWIDKKYPKTRKE